MGKSKPRTPLDEIARLKETKPIDELERKLAAKDAELRSARADNKRLVSRNAELCEALDRIAAIQQSNSVARLPVRRKSKGDEHHAIALIQWSDWHVAEKVDKNKTYGLNEYNPEIARRRVAELAENTLKMLSMYRTHVRVEEMVLQLGGDFVTGNLHPELAETNCMGMMEEAYFAQELLEAAVSKLLNAAKMKRVRVVALRGNHGRTTKRMQYKNDYETSVESMLYWNLRTRLNGEGVDWHIPKSDVAYTALQPAYELRSIHGHQIKYKGGVGGIGIPLHKWIWKQDATRPAIVTQLGHFHTFEPGRRFFICGSLKGWDEYAASLGFEHEPPSQAISLFDCRRKLVTGRYPIFCE